MVMGELILDTDLAVLGSGPGGYTAAIHAADLGLDVILVESGPDFGGVCLTEGCIPSKTLMNAIHLKETVKNAKNMGLTFGNVDIDILKLRQWIKTVVGSLSNGIATLLQNREIDIVRGHGRFVDENKIYVEGTNTIIKFKNAIIATGSRINELPSGMDVPVWTSATALSLPEVPASLLVIGGGYVGLEIGQAFAGLGSKITLVEFSPQLLPGADRDLVNVVLKKCKEQFSAIHTESKVNRIEKTPSGFLVSFEKAGKKITQTFDKVLAATGRHPNTNNIGLDKLGLTLNKKGLIPTDEMCRTEKKHIFAVGDVTKGPGLAHKAVREGKVAVEVIAGAPSAFDNRAIPAVLFTNPEIAWTGITEKEAEQKKISFKKGLFPLTALGRAKSIGKTTGFIKIIADAETSLILGMGIVGEHASEMISEGTLAIEMGACLEDLIVSIHPHPTFSESIMEAAEMAKGGSVHLLKKGT